MAGTSLVINILADASEAQKALKQTESSVDGLGQSTRNMGKVVAAGAAAGAAAIVALGVDAFNAAEESAKIGRETARVISTTGAAAWQSADGVAALAGALSDKTGADDEAIQSGANLLLTFTNVQNAVGDGNDVFDRATAAALDMSTALGTDMSGAALQLGKALNDPVKGLTALSKAGVSFTQEQKEQVRVLQESGDALGAQKIILGEVEKEFKGAAEAAGTPLDKLRVAIGNLQEDIGAKLIPPVSAAAEVMLNALGPAVGKASRFLEEHGEAVKFLATVGLVGLAASYAPVVIAQASLMAQGITSFLFETAAAAYAAGQGFLTMAADEGIATAATTTLNAALTAAGPLMAVVALGAAVYGMVGAFTASSESATKFIDTVRKEVPTGNFDAMADSQTKIYTEGRKATEMLNAQKGTISGIAGGVADILIPFHNMEDSMVDNAQAVNTLADSHTEYQQKLDAANLSLATFAETSVLAAHGLDTTGKASLAATEANKPLLDQMDATGETLKRIAEQKGIDPVAPGAVDKITALYDRTQVASAGTLQMTDAQEKFNDVTSDAKDKVDAYKSSLDALTGAHMSAAAAETNFNQNTLTLMTTLGKNTEAIRGMADQTDASKAATLEHAAIINTNNKAVQDNVKSAMDLANATYQEQQGIVGSKDALKLATDGLTAHRDQLIAVMVQMGYTEVQAKAYVDRLGLTPDNIQTQMNLNTQPADAALAATQKKLIDASTGVYTPTMGLDISPMEAQIKKAMALFKGVNFGPNQNGVSVQGAMAPVGGLVPVPVPVAVGRAGVAVTAPAPVYNISISHSGLGVDSPRLQRDIVDALRRWEKREGPAHALGFR
jgi:hypothetical protein